MVWKELRNRSALFCHHNEEVSFEERLKTRETLISRLENQLVTLENHSALVIRLQNQVSTLLEEQLDQERTIRTQLANLTATLCKATPTRGKIFHMTSPKGRYKYALDEARQACAEKGAVLASIDQLHQAWQDGLERCDCGWLSDGTAHYPMQQAFKHCGDRKDVIECDRKPTDMYNAWCFRSICTAND
ncbi:hyaluronan and proteoglycan link protein 1-like [Branchiostoma lanceolatum]|uniref:hyaluronan and proteoglycan link protein 1-like n=1 Tax=Branchiostoma lanceolatum TaxID=7740 RepID=UPI0034523C98